MKAGHWLIAIIVVAALAWWTFGHPGYETGEQRMVRAQAEQAAIEEARPKLYKWRDADGNLQVSDHPPKGRKYETVDMDAQQNVNVIPMSEAIDPAPAASTAPKPR